MTFCQFLLVFLFSFRVEHQYNWLLLLLFEMVLTLIFFCKDIPRCSANTMSREVCSLGERAVGCARRAHVEVVCMPSSLHVNVGGKLYSTVRSGVRIFPVVSLELSASDARRRSTLSCWLLPAVRHSGLVLPLSLSLSLSLSRSLSHALLSPRSYPPDG